MKKITNKNAMSIIEQRLGIAIDPHSMFQMQIKRIHEYKRQTLSVLQLIARYNRIRDGGGSDVAPHTVLEEHQRGYRFLDRLLRPARGKVSVAPPDPVRAADDGEES